MRVEKGIQWIPSWTAIGSACALCLWLFAPLSSFPCTVFNVTDRGRTLVGSNKDWTTDRFRVQVLPAEGDVHGIVVFGVDEPIKYPFFGVNDRGLFFDLASVPRRSRIEMDPAKETRDNPIYLRMLARCGNVAEAVAFLSHYNIAGLRRHHIMIVDRGGASVVIEGGPGARSILQKNGRYQIMTNFLLSSFGETSHPKCARYAMAEKTLKETAVSSIDLVRSILRGTTNTSSSYPTILSSIFDLSSLRVTIYRRGNFEDSLEIDLRDELRKGIHRFFLSSRS